MNKTGLQVALTFSLKEAIKESSYLLLGKAGGGENSVALAVKNDFDTESKLLELPQETIYVTAGGGSRVRFHRLNYG